MSLDCQCDDDLPYTHDRIDTWLPGLRRWAAHPDWRVREWAAWRWALGASAVDINNMMRLIRDGRDPTDLRLPRGPAWDALGDQFALDSHPAIRAHVLDDPADDVRRGPQDNSAAAAAAVREGDPALISELPLAQRRMAASGRFGPAPRVLLEDPICAIRLDTLRHLDEGARTPALLAWLSDDPCRWVRVTVRDAQGRPPDSRNSEGIDAPLPAQGTQSEDGDGTRIHLGDHRQFSGCKELDGAFSIVCNWCGARDYSYTDDILDRFPNSHRCDVVPLDRQHITALADRIDAELGTSRYALTLCEGHKAQINTHWLLVSRRAGTAQGVPRGEFQSLLALLAAASERNRWTIGFIFTQKAAAQVLDQMLDFDFSPHDRRNGHRYTHTGQIYLHRPTTPTSPTRIQPKAPPPAVELETDPAGHAEHDLAAGAPKSIDEESPAWRATHDQLTGLLNRATLVGILEDPPTHLDSGALIVMDIDRIGEINGELSPGIGDQVISHVAGLLAEHTPDSSIAARTGGGEFIVLLPEVTPRDTARMLQHLFGYLQSPLRIPAGRVRVSVSAGCAYFGAGSSLNDVFDRALAALNHANANGGGTYVIDPG